LSRGVRDDGGASKRREFQHLHSTFVISKYSRKTLASRTFTNRAGIVFKRFSRRDDARPAVALITSASKQKFKYFIPKSSETKNFSINFSKFILREFGLRNALLLGYHLKGILQRLTPT